MLQCEAFQVVVEPGRIKHVLYLLKIIISNGLQIEMRRPAGKAGLPLAVDGHELQTTRGYTSRVTCFGRCRFTHAVIDHEQDFHVLRAVSGINQNCTLFELATVRRQYEISRGAYQRMTGVNQIRHGFAMHLHQMLFEADALVFFEYRRAGFADDAVTLANGGRYMP